MLTATRSHSSSSAGSTGSRGQQPHNNARSASSPFVYYPPPAPPKDGRRPAQPGERGWVVWQKRQSRDTSDEEKEVEVKQSEKHSHSEQRKEKGKGATTHRAALVFLSGSLSIHAPLNPRHDTAAGGRHHQPSRHPQAPQRGAQQTRSDSRTSQDDESEDEAMEEEQVRVEKDNARQRKRKAADRDGEDERLSDTSQQRRRQQDEDEDEDSEAQSSSRVQKGRAQLEEETKEDDPEEEANPPLHNTSKRARHAAMVDDVSDSDDEQSEWTVVGQRQRSQIGAASKGSSRPALSVSLTSSYESNTCAECRLMAKLHCSTKRCKKHCVKMGKACKAHGCTGKEKRSNKSNRQPDSTVSRPRETINIADGDDEDDVPLLRRQRGERGAGQSRGDEREQEEMKEDNHSEESDDQNEADEEKEEKQPHGRAERDDQTRLQIRVEGEQVRSETTAAPDGQQIRPQRTHSKGSMDLSSVLRQQMELRKAVTERQQLQQQQQVGEQQEQKQSTLQPPTLRDYESQALIESQLEDALLHSPTPVASLRAAVAPAVVDESYQPPTDSKAAEHENSSVALEASQSLVHTTPISHSSASASVSASNLVETHATADSPASLYLPSAGEGDTIRLHGPPVLVLYALYIHCGSQLNAHRWLNSLPALCKAGHVVGERPTEGYACNLCNCAAPWEAAEDVIVRQMMDNGSRQSDKEEMDPLLQQLLSDRGGEALALRRSFLQTNL